MTVETYHPPNATVIREGDVGDRFYLIRDGRVAVKKGGARTSCGTRPRRLLWEMALLTGIRGTQAS